MSKLECSLVVIAMLAGACGGGGDSGTELDGTVRWSPFTDELDAFDHPHNNGFAELEVLQEASIGTGDCAMLAIPAGKTEAQTRWAFRAPSGHVFSDVHFALSAYKDGRATNDARADVSLDVPNDDGTFTLHTLVQAGPGDLTQVIAQEDLTAAVRGKDSFQVWFTLENPDAVTDLERIFVQALRQCPGEPTAFEIVPSIGEAR